MRTALLLSALCLAGCGPAIEPVAQDTVEETAQQKSYALAATRYDWPAASQNQSLADNLLTQNYYLVFDGSGSMSDSKCASSQEKIDVAKSAINKFIQNIPSTANIGLYVFDHYGAQERVPLGQNRSQLIESVKRVLANGGTPLRSAAEAGYEALTKQAQKQLGYGEYHLVIITDGEASNNEDPEPIVRKILRESPVQIHTIGFCIGEGHSLNIPGQTYYAAASNPAELDAGLAQVLAEADDYNLLDYNGSEN
ncbi:vWA domain-containing protein [Rheinheimera baltica]|uniref:VWA domain-containing protein n=1 Tax=Rheinheimera baltica TaxID=67576 RepID=A0ABT9I3V0_9GAMM|nr:vWA domain-containing protein [Rheinheimera baltica]MDP5138069.1 VWA domain-containing protein [Rheinheimera baltica]MDP5144724.1 VWA domain-containing protein [Rheinheimera baltica]MDP5151957.1 VWA domain-containing protein [Rheinheimera baltica]MDP5191528.1 VWA domain-containing protein [Rheinheimera baltica]